MSRDETLDLLRRWWRREPEFGPDVPPRRELADVMPPLTPELARSAFFEVIEAIERRDWAWRLEEDDLYSARVMGEEGYFAEPCGGTSTSGLPYGPLEALLEAYLKACEHPENRP